MHLRVLLTAICLALVSATSARATASYQQNLVNIAGSGSTHGSAAYLINTGSSPLHAFFFQIQSGVCVPTPSDGENAFYLGGQVSNYFYVQACDGAWAGDGQYHWTMYDLSGNSPCGGVAGACNSFSFGDWAANNYAISNWSGGAYLDPSGTSNPALILQDDTTPPPTPRGLPITVTHAETLLLQDATTVWGAGTGPTPVFTPFTLSPLTTPYKTPSGFLPGKIHIGSNVDDSSNNHDGIGNLQAQLYDANGNFIASSTNTCYGEGGCNGADLTFSSQASVPADFALTFVTVDGLQGDAGWTVSNIGIYAEDPHPTILGSSLNQLAADGATTIPEGGTTAGSQVDIVATPQSSSQDALILQVEVEPSGVSFINIVSAASPPVFSGQGASVVLPGLAATQYHWQARVVDLATLIASPWQAFGPVGGVDFITTSGTFAPPSVMVSPNPVVFPIATNAVTVTVTNAGGTTLHFSQDPAISGFNQFDFGISTTGTTCGKGVSLSPQASCVLDVTFSPLKPAMPFAESALLSLFDDAGDSPQAISVSGGAGLSAIFPNPIPGSSSPDTVAFAGTGLLSAATITASDLTSVPTGGDPPPTLAASLSSNALTASLNFGTATSIWQVQISGPDGTSLGPYYFQVLGAGSASNPPYLDDYPYQNAINCPLADSSSQCPDYTVDPYGFFFRECTSYVAWRMNRDANTKDPMHPSFFNKMGGGKWGEAKNWYANAVRLGFDVDPAETPEVGDIAQWISIDHVAYVEKVYNDGSGAVDVSEFNFGADESGIYCDPKVAGACDVRKFFFGIRTHVVPEDVIHMRRVSLGSPSAGFSASQSSLTFSPQPVQATTTLPIVVTNINIDRSIEFASIGIAPPTDISFSVADTSTCIVGIQVPAGGSCEIDVTFVPSKKGTLSTTLELVGNAGTQLVSLVGTGLGPLSYSPKTLDFGSVALGATSASRSFTLTNQTGGDVAMSTIPVGFGDFTTSATSCGTVLSLGSSCALAVTFSPGALGSEAAIYAVNDNAVGSPQVVNVEGTGILPVAVNPSAVTFATRAVGTTSPAKTITVKNNLPTPLSLSNMTIEGSNAADFTLSASSCGGSLNAGSTCTVDVSFEPGGVGTRSAVVAISDGAITSPQVISLVGVGK